MAVESVRPPLPVLVKPPLPLMAPLRVKLVPESVLTPTPLASTRSAAIVWLPVVMEMLGEPVPPVLSIVNVPPLPAAIV